MLSLLKADDSGVRSRAADAIAKLRKQSIEVQPLLMQWLEQHPDDQIGSVIDTLWSIVIEK